MGEENGVADKKAQKQNGKSEGPIVDKEDKPKPSLADINHQKNVATIVNFMMPAVLLIYLGLVLLKYNITEFNGLVTNKYLLLGFKDLQTLKDAIVQNVVDSSVWGLTYLYIRRWLNPDSRGVTFKYIQDGYFGSVASFATTLLKQVIKNFNK